jgi:hypothetical protein
MGNRLWLENGQPNVWLIRSSSLVACTVERDNPYGVSQLVDDDSPHANRLVGWVAAGPAEGDERWTM